MSVVAESAGATFGVKCARPMRRAENRPHKAIGSIAEIAIDPIRSLSLESDPIRIDAKFRRLKRAGCNATRAHSSGGHYATNACALIRALISSDRSLGFAFTYTFGAF